MKPPPFRGRGVMQTADRVYMTSAVAKSPAESPADMRSRKLLVRDLFQEQESKYSRKRQCHERVGLSKGMDDRRGR